MHLGDLVHCCTRSQCIRSPRCMSFHGMTWCMLFHGIQCTLGVFLREMTCSVGVPFQAVTCTVGIACCSMQEDAPWCMLQRYMLSHEIKCTVGALFHGRTCTVGALFHGRTCPSVHVAEVNGFPWNNMPTAVQGRQDRVHTTYRLMWEIWVEYESRTNMSHDSCAMGLGRHVPEAVRKRLEFELREVCSKKSAKRRHSMGYVRKLSFRYSLSVLPFTGHSNLFSFC